MTVASNIDERISKCQKILEGDPNSQIFAALAEAYRKKGQLDKAFKVCQNGLRVHPSYGSAHIVMAKINLDRGMYDWAEVEVNKAIELDGSNRATELLLAEIQIYKGEFPAAIRLLKKLHEGDPNNAQIKKLLMIAKKIPEEQKAIMAPPTQPAPEQTPAPATPAEPEPVLTAVGLMEAVLSVEQVKGCLSLDNSGQVLDSLWHLPMDQETCGTSMAEICNFLTQELVRTPLGMTECLLIESEKHVFLIVRVQDGMFAFVATTNVNLGSFRMKVMSLVENFTQTQSG